MGLYARIENVPMKDIFTALVPVAEKQWPWCHRMIVDYAGPYCDFKTVGVYFECCFRWFCGRHRYAYVTIDSHTIAEAHDPFFVVEAVVEDCARDIGEFLFHYAGAGYGWQP